MKRAKKKQGLPPQLFRGDRRDFLKVSGLAALSLGLPGLGGCGDDGGQSGGDGGSDGGINVEPFMVVALPDTQVYAEEFPQVYTAQTKWVVDNRAKENIAFLTHLGDVVDNGPSLTQWQNARASMKLLDDADMPYGVCLGNHDVQYSNDNFKYPINLDTSCGPYRDFDCKAEHFLTNFGPARFSGRSWYSGASPSGMSSYQTINIAPELKLVFLHICLDFPADELTWAQKVVDENADAAIHVSTHRYLYDYRLVKGLPFPLDSLLGGRSHELIYTLDAKLYYNDSITASKFFTNFVKPNTNIFMVQCGHVDAEYRQVSENAAGLPVHEMLADFQTFDARADGWMRLLRFDPARKKVSVRTYSPHLDANRENGAGLDASLQALSAGYQLFAERYADVLDVEAMRQTLDYWLNDPAGKAEYKELAYGEGHRDSEFELDLDLMAYPKSRQG